MEFTDEEIQLVALHRAKKNAEAEVQEAVKRRKAIAKTLADLINEARTILQDAKRIAVDNGFEYQIGDMVTEMINDVSDNQQWYGSDQSLC